MMVHITTIPITLIYITLIIIIIFTFSFPHQIINKIEIHDPILIIYIYIYFIQIMLLFLMTLLLILNSILLHRPTIQVTRIPKNSLYPNNTTLQLDKCNKSTNQSLLNQLLLNYIDQFYFLQIKIYIQLILKFLKHKVLFSRLFKFI